MAPRKRKKKQIDEGPFLFSEEERLGMISNVNVIETTFPEKTDVPLAPETIVEEPLNVHNDIQTEAEHESELVHVSVLPLEELSTDERIVQAMTNVLWQMRDMDKSQIRRIAFSITVMCQQGVELNRSYSAPVIQDDDGHRKQLIVHRPIQRQRYSRISNLWKNICLITMSYQG